MTETTFKDFLREYIDIKGLSVKKLSNLTNIPERYLDALIEGDIDSLPPSPYILGYIGKLAEVLEFDKNEMWRLYKRDNNLDGSGSFDRLPSNRYATKTINKKLLIIGVVSFLILIYLIWNFNKLLGTPPLKLTYPAAENLIVHQSTISIEGRTDTNAKLVINDNEVLVDQDGRFQKKYILSPGLNIITIVSKKLLGKAVTIDRKIIYEPPPSSSPPLINELIIDEQQLIIEELNE